MRRFLIALIITVTMLALVSCQAARGISYAAINERGELVIAYTDGTSENLGRVVGYNGADGKDGADGIDGADGTNGKDGADGINGTDGKDAVTPTVEISSDGFWVINGVKTEHRAIGKDGENGKDGVSPTVEISPDGYWVINGEKTNMPAVSTGGSGAEAERQGLAFSLKDDGSYSVSIGTATNLTTLTIPDKYNGAPVSEIAAGGFASDKLAELTIGASVTEIGANAFSACPALTSIKFDTGSGITTLSASCFAGCTALSAIEIPDSVTEIGASAFSGCTSLKTVSFGAQSALASVGEGVFVGCTSVEEMTVPFIGAERGATGGYFSYLFGGKSASTSLASVPSSLLRVTVLAPSDIAEYAFYNCKSIKEIRLLGDGVGSIATSAFMDCVALESIELPDGVGSIGSRAFDGCTSLLSVTLPESVSELGNACFYECSSLASVTLGGRIKTISSSVFEHCISLESINLPAGLESIGTYAFAYCTSLCSIDIPDSVTSLGAKAFYYCDFLKSVRIGGGITEIPSEAFYYCSSLALVDIGDSVTTIGSSAFYNCTAIRRLTVGKSVTTLGTNAFNAKRVISLYNLTGKTLSGLPSATETYTNREAVDNLIADGDLLYYWDGFECGYYLVGYLGTSRAVTVPATYDGLALDYYSAVFAGVGITEVTLEEGITEIPASMFNGCDKLLTVNLPYSLERVGSNAFYNCSKVATVNISDIARWCAIEFAGAGDYSNPLANGRASLYVDGVLIDNLSLPSYVTEISAGAFNSYGKLVSVTLHSGITSVGENAFRRCSALVAVYIDDLSAYAAIDFADVDASPLYCAENLYLNRSLLKSATIDGAKIGSFAFAGAGSLTSVTVADTVKIIGKGAFYESAVATVVIGGGITELPEDCFYRCDSLTSVNIKSGVKVIREGAFGSCSSLTTIALPEGLTEIESWAFSISSKLASISLPTTLTLIHANAFSNCSKLTSVSFAVTDGWTVTGVGSLTSAQVADTASAATLLASTYKSYEWKREV